MEKNKIILKRLKEKILSITKLKKIKESERKISNELSTVEKLIEKCRFNDALELINELEEKSEINTIVKFRIHILKSFLLVELQNYKEAFKYSEQAYQESKDFKDELRLLDIYINQIEILINFKELRKAFDFITMSESLLKLIVKEPITQLNKRKAALFWIKGFYFFILGDLVKSLENYIQALKISKEIKNKYLTCKCLNSIGVISLSKGELDEALKYFEKSLNIAEEINWKRRLLGTFDNIGILYYQKGNLELASKYMEQSLAYSEDLELTSTTVLILCDIIDLSLNKGDINTANILLDKLQRIYKKERTNSIKAVYRLSEALILKATGSAISRGKAEEKLKRLLDENVLQYQHKVIAILNLCDLLLIELRNSCDIEILKDIQSYILQLSNYAEQNYSYALLTETYLLQARLALIVIDLKGARKFLSKSEQIAEKFGLNRLAQKISSEHDELLNQLSIWEDLKESETSLTELMDFARLDNQMRRMVHKHAVESSEVSSEEPVLLLIIAEGGIPVFSNSFTSKISVKDYLVSGFLTAINSFSDEFFSEGLDRAKFGEHMILLKSIDTFLICYLFKGQSYIAKQKLEYFAKHLRASTPIWEAFNEFYKKNKIITLEENPIFESLFTEVFIKKERWTSKR
ncbi:MAG: tetratricopeptide repeat protein [Candidatus Thorarchaeota archaeon]